MDKQIHEVYTFFKEKIIAGEYTLVSVDSATATVEIHGHNFVIWIKNGAFGVSTYNGSFMNIEFSETEKEEAWVHLIEIQREHMRGVVSAKIAEASAIAEKYGL